MIDPFQSLASEFGMLQNVGFAKERASAYFRARCCSSNRATTTKLIAW